MSRKQLAITLVTLILTAPLVVAAAPAPASSTEPAAATAWADPVQADRVGTEPEHPTRAEPVTPFPMNLPDAATAEEIKGEHGIGIGLLIFAAALGVALAGTVFYYLSFRSWHHEPDGVPNEPQPGSAAKSFGPLPRK